MFPVIGGKPVDLVDTSDVLKVLALIWLKKPMLIVPLTALAQDKNEKRDEKKKKAEEKKEKAKDKAEDAKDSAKDAVEDHDKVVDGPGTDRSQERRQDRRRDAVKK